LGDKFVKDAERFNKWGVEADYAVLKYGRKVDCLRLLDKVGKEAGTRRSNKGSKHTADNNGEGGARNNRQRREGS
jgi:hypothetical protein